MRIEKKTKCTGCGACFNACPKNAITMQTNEYGFYEPIINEELCIDCGLCSRICPLTNYKSYNIQNPSIFSFQNDDNEILYKCASGGMFAKLAKNIIEQKGVVYGVIYDENFVVCHSRTEDLTGLEKMYSSKYVQSDTRNTFKQAQKDLEQDRHVLFSGTPCQIAGLKSYLKKDYEKLITVDLVCHGVPSTLVFEKYKQEFMAKLSEEEKLLSINFRSKVEGWKTELVTTTTTTTTTHAKHDDFMQAFLYNLSINTPCLDCQFNKIPRIADFTIGDFWGVEKYDNTMNNDKGISIVLLNSHKSKTIFSNIQRTNYIKEIPLSVVLKYNPNIIGSSKPHRKRLHFLNDIKNGKSLSFCVQKYAKPPIYMKFYYFLPQFIKNFIKYVILKKEND